MDNNQLSEHSEDLAADPMDTLDREKKTASSGKGVAVLALLLALAAAGASGWQWWQMYQSGLNEGTQKQPLTRLQTSQQQLAGKLASIEARLEATESSLNTTDESNRLERLKAVESKLDGLQGRTGEDQASISAVQGSVRSLEQRLATTESGLVSVAASSQNSSLELDIAEIDFLLRAASERLHLLADPTAADLALQAADVQI